MIIFTADVSMWIDCCFDSFHKILLIIFCTAEKQKNKDI